LEKKSVPQDDSSTYAKMKKTIFAKNRDGRIRGFSSSGWDVEETVTRQALDDIENSAKKSFIEVKSGRKSPLYFYMYKQKMDLLLLSQTTGFFKWTIKRDFEPEIFAEIKESRLLVYCDALGIGLDEIKELPSE